MIGLAIASYLLAVGFCLAASQDLGESRRYELKLSGWCAFTGALFAASGTWCLYQ